MPIVRALSSSTIPSRVLRSRARWWLLVAAITAASLPASVPTQTPLPAIEAGEPSAASSAGPPAGPSVARCRPAWLAPVQAPVVDPFRPPSDPYGPGNRGLEYGTVPGQPVSAVAAGQVAFAGPVGGAPVVSIDHGGGLRSTYTRLVGTTARRGQIVAAGDVVATADAAFHLGAVVDRRYIDPAILLERTCVVIRLVPT